MPHNEKITELWSKSKMQKYEKYFLGATLNPTELESGRITNCQLAVVNDRQVTSQGILNGKWKHWRQAKKKMREHFCFILENWKEDILMNTKLFFMIIHNNIKMEE